MLFAIMLVLGVVAMPIDVVAKLSNAREFNLFVLAQILVSGLLYIWLCFGTIQFFKKREFAPQVLIAWFWGRIIGRVIMFFAGLVVFGPGDELLVLFFGFITSTVGGIIWILYLKKSKRVFATFVK